MSHLADLLTRRKAKKQELKTYTSRKSKLEAIKKDFENDFDDMIQDAVKYNEKSSSELLKGLKGDGVPVVNTLCYDIEYEKEKNLYVDDKMYSISTDINNEINRCTSEIEKLEIEIRRLDRQIEAARDSED